MSSESPTEDTRLGAFVYCREHVAPHTSGWCNVGLDRKLGMLAKTVKEAAAEVQKLGLPWYRHCRVCYVLFGPNTPSGTIVCPEHSRVEVEVAKRRVFDLDRYLRERAYLDTLAPNR